MCLYAVVFLCPIITKTGVSPVQFVNAVYALFISLLFVILTEVLVYYSLDIFRGLRFVCFAIYRFVRCAVAVLWSWGDFAIVLALCLEMIRFYVEHFCDLQ